MIFNSLKQQDLLVIVFILAKLIQMKLRWIRPLVTFHNKSKPKTKEGKDIFICPIESLSEMMKNAFLAHIRSSFRSQDM